MASTTDATKEERMATLKGSETHQNLKRAFAGEAAANRRYVYFARQADIEGYPEIAGLFRDTAEGETGHANGHMEFLKRLGDPVTDLPIGGTARNLESAIAGETSEYTTQYPKMAETARAEGFDDVAEWFETLAKAERNHSARFAAGLKALRA
jgi:rubrerythrin